MNQPACENLDDYLADDLDDRRRNEFERHLEACPACRQELLAQAELDRLLRAATEAFEAAPAKLPAGIRRQLAAARSRRRRSLGAAALVAVVIVWAASWVLHDARDERAAARPQPLQRRPEQREFEQRQAGADGGEDSRPQDESETANAAGAAVAAAAELRVASSSEMIAVPISSKNPNVTIFWLYPTVRTAGR